MSRPLESPEIGTSMILFLFLSLSFTRMSGSRCLLISYKILYSIALSGFCSHHSVDLSKATLPQLTQRTYLVTCCAFVCILTGKCTVLDNCALWLHPLIHTFYKGEVPHLCQHRARYSSKRLFLHATDQSFCTSRQVAFSKPSPGLTFIISFPISDTLLTYPFL